VFEYRLAREVHEALSRHGVRYLFLGKSGAILLGFPDTTQDADLFPEKSPENGRAIVAALQELGFDLAHEDVAAIERGTGLVQLKTGPIDVDLITLPMASNRSTTPSSAASKWTACPSATWTTSSPASERPAGPRTRNRCPV
jgi:hypothetical protein